jgi:hypothetical protein
MANLFVVWNIKERRAESVHETSPDATSAIRKSLSKSGSSTNGKTYAASSTNFEVITVTR